MVDRVLMPKQGEVYVSSKRENIYITDVNIEDNQDYVVFYINEKDKDDLDYLDEDDMLIKEEWERFAWFYQLEKKAP
ncbi:hypothetical protein SAMN02745753_03500 [Marinomonas polaris DSM 16579]|uniref:Uncharacterized protein n=1 Tax=Marinomonas polaris DSM 16579 TaxID=1122206 RepID=A0A1M5I3M4_9GAMM|nr:hypothetical protein [Marinomonas polaris]SHG22915.1 hypothetical protein SAMN02745753_03500 [Marinomonas polaris DSM 16579]